MKKMAHMGELTTLLRYLDPVEAELFEEGAEEVHEMLEELGIESGSSEAQDSRRPDSRQPD